MRALSCKTFSIIRWSEDFLSIFFNKTYGFCSMKNRKISHIGTLSLPLRYLTLVSLSLRGFVSAVLQLVTYYTFHRKRLLFCRLTRLYEEDGKAHNGIPSVKRTVFRYIRTRMIVGSLALSVSVISAILGPVSKCLHRAQICLCFILLLTYSKIMRCSSIHQIFWYVRNYTFKIFQLAKTIFT